MQCWTRRVYTNMLINSRKDNNWIYETSSPKPGKKKPEKAPGKRRRKPAAEKYWIITKVIEGKPYYMSEVEVSQDGMGTATYTWNGGKEGMEKANIFLDEDEAWDLAYRARGMAITMTARAEEKKNAADKD